MSKMRVGFSKTINIGNYESIKISVEVEEDFHKDYDDYEGIFDAIFANLEKIVQEKEEEIRGN